MTNENFGNIAKNTDKEIWREREGDYYCDAIFVTENGNIGIDCGGYCIAQPIRKWFELAAKPRSLAAELNASPLSEDDRKRALGLMALASRFYKDEVRAEAALNNLESEFVVTRKL